MEREEGGRGRKEGERRMERKKGEKCICRKGRKRERRLRGATDRKGLGTGQSVHMERWLE